MADEHNELVKQILADRLSDGDIVVHWILTARVEGLNNVTTVIGASDDGLDVVTHLGLTEAAKSEAMDRFNGLTPYTYEDDEDDDEGQS